MNKSKPLLIIDGSNFYHYVKKIIGIKVDVTKVDFTLLARKITKRKGVQINYSVGEIRPERGNRKSHRLYAKQQKLFYSLEKQGINISKGYMLKTGNRYHEKGVDVQIAVDIVKGALKCEFEECYLLSSDTDLLPAIHVAREAGKKVTYVGFRGLASRALRTNCDKVIWIKRKWLGF